MAGFVAGACLLSGLLLLDRWQVAELGVSQPIVACPLIGIAFGEAAAGIYLGLVLQLIWSASLPLGREQALDYQGAGVASILVYTLLVRLIGPAAADQARALFAALFAAGLATFVGAWLDSGNKRFNGRLFAAGARSEQPARIVALHAAGIGTGFVRGVMLAGLFLGLAAACAPLVRLLPVFSKSELLALPLGIGVAAAARMFITPKRLPWFLAGAAAAGGLWLLVRV